MTPIESTTAFSRDLVRVRGRSIGAREEVLGTTCRKNSDFWRNYTSKITPRNYNRILYVYLYVYTYVYVYTFKAFHRLLRMLLFFLAR
jgi:hypothetical protein